MEICLREDDLRGDQVARLLRQHLDHAALHSPPESIHALDLDSLRAPEITFWTAWNGPALVGCGALRDLDPRHGEVKSMHTAAAHRGRGVGARLVAHLVDLARGRGYDRLSLETGSTTGIAPARVLYARFGFEPGERFADYRDDPFSVFMSLDLNTWRGGGGPVRR